MGMMVTAVISRVSNTSLPAAVKQYCVLSGRAANMEKSIWINDAQTG
jgi:hypothetical protein